MTGSKDTTKLKIFLSMINYSFGAVERSRQQGVSRGRSVAVAVGVSLSWKVSSDMRHVTCVT